MEDRASDGFLNCWKKDNKQRQVAVNIITLMLGYIIVIPFIILGKILKFVYRISDAVCKFL